VRAQFAPAAPEIVMVGDRGMIKSKGIAQLTAAGMRHITALTDAQTLKLIHQKTIAPELFDETAADIEHDGRRLILTARDPLVRNLYHGPPHGFIILKNGWKAGNGRAAESTLRLKRDGIQRRG